MPAGTDASHNSKHSAVNTAQTRLAKLPPGTDASPALLQQISTVTPVKIPKGLPEWMNDALECFNGLDTKNRYARWPRLLELWIDFEKAAGFTGNKARLTCNHRPEEIKHWISRGRRYDRLPIVKSLGHYATAWKKWWATMQPQCRQPEGAAQWPLLLVAPENPSEWNIIRINGSNGLFIIIVSLAIWLQAADAELDVLKDLTEAIEDAHWVLGALTPSRAGSKRAAPSEPERSNKKTRSSKRTAAAAAGK
ncbi:hypothetical protein ONZ51_g12119 [Trametes cubensis]|uniref:Uncharacterized protein n=1 Tax=Trametes cubensis TaxID=1111947 RepID=A0AAD7X3P6_9APHY|nr:hypothetical protein ONZ51_g12119 [Trametes cubensis]